MMQSSLLGIEEGQGKYDSITEKNSFPDTVEKKSAKSEAIIFYSASQYTGTTKFSHIV